jgi:hypothetical protein
MEHFLDYMKPTRAQKIKERTEAEIKAGGIPNYVNYVMPYRMEESDNGFILLAEVYNPSSTSNSFANPYGPYNPYYYNPYNPYYYPGFGRFYSPYPYNSQRTVAEIKTIASLVVAVDATGKVIWDWSTVINETERVTMDQVSDFHFHQGVITIIYKQESELKVKRVVLSSKEETLHSEKIKPKEPLDEIRSDKENSGGIRFWYGDSFYVWGYQSIRNISREDRTRDVFYINKIRVK